MSELGRDWTEDGSDALAAEIALGLVSRDDPAVAARLAADPALRAEVARSEARFAGLAADVPPATPRAAVWAAVERATAPAVRQPTAAPPLPSLPARIWRSLAFWRLVSAGSLAATAAALILVLGQPAPRTLVAALSPNDDMSVMISLDPGDGMLTMVPVSFGPTDASVPELWLIPPGMAPMSLGVMPMDGPQEMPVDPGMMPHFSNGVTLAVSMEPPGGSPTGAPTGPVVASGVLTSL